MKAQFTEKEIEWIGKLEKANNTLEFLQNEKEKDNQSISLTKSYIHFIELIIKYENLRLNKDWINTVSKKVIKVNMWQIQVKMIESLGFECVGLDGLYVAQDIMFVPPEVVEDYKHNIKIDKIYDNCFLDIAKVIKGEDDNYIGVSLLKDSYIVNRWLNNQPYSCWDYIIF